MKKSRLFGVFCAGLFCLGLAESSGVTAAIVQNPDNGHFYELVMAPGISWDQANEEANTRAGNWHLVTITDAAENAFIKSLLEPGEPFFTADSDCANAAVSIGRICGGIWLGGTRPCDSCSGWTWVTGETWSFTDWGPLEPIIGALLSLDEFRDLGPLLAWNDKTAQSAPASGYIVETYDVGAYVSIDIPDGTTQECIATGGSNVTMVSSVFVGDPNEIVSILWYLDEDSTPIASGDTVEFFVPTGPHSVKATVFTVTLGESSDTESISIEDTVAPQVNPVFINPKDGTVITSVSHKGDVNISEGVIDICDPAPTITSVVGLPTQEGDTLGIKGNKNDASITVTSGPNTETITLMVTAEDASGNVSSDSTVLTVTR